MKESGRRQTCFHLCVHYLPFGIPHQMETEGQCNGPITRDKYCLQKDIQEEMAIGHATGRGDDARFAGMMGSEFYQYHILWSAAVLPDRLGETG